MFNIHDEFYPIAQELERKHVNYALIGGVAVAIYGTPRHTEDIDILVIPEDADKVKEILDAKGYFESAKPWTFKNSNIQLRRFMKIVDKDALLFDLMVALDQKHRAMIERAGIADWRDTTVRLAQKADLITLKSVRNTGTDQDDIKFLQQT